MPGRGCQILCRLPMFLESQRGCLGQFTCDLSVIIQFDETAQPGVFILIQQMAVIGSLGSRDLIGRQFVLNPDPLAPDLAAMRLEPAINLHRSQSDQPQGHGPVLGLEREGFLGFRIAVLDVLRDGSTVIIDRSTAGQTGVYSHGNKPHHCNTSP